MSKSIAVGGAQNDGFVGDVITSTLTEAQFQAQRNGTWVLMDGRNVNGSKYASITGTSVIPDGRGQFLRGKNNGRGDGQENPAGDLIIGTQQTDEFKSHFHSMAGSFLNNGLAGGGQGVLTQSGATNTGDTGGLETRPKNITVNFFIKIN